MIPASSLRAAIAYLGRALGQSVSRTIWDPILESPRTSDPDPVADVAYARRLLGETWQATCATCRHCQPWHGSPRAYVFCVAPTPVQVYTREKAETWGCVIYAPHPQAITRPDATEPS